MGIIKNLLTAKVSGNVGSMNFRKRGSQIVAAGRSYTNKSKGNGATLAQRTHRCKLAGMVNFFRLISNVERKAWQGKPENTSDFNMFVKYNLSASPWLIAKDAAKAGICSIGDWQVSMGSLTPINTRNSDTKCFFDLGLPESITATSTIAQLSAAIVAADKGFQYGDQLTFVTISSKSTSVGDFEFPKFTTIVVEVTLSSSNSSKVSDLLAPFGDSVILSNGGFKVDDSNKAGFAIHSRQSPSGLLTSTQSIMMGNDMQSVWEVFEDEEYIKYALDSYGYQEDVLLTPNVD